MAHPDDIVAAGLEHDDGAEIRHLPALAPVAAAHPVESRRRSLALTAPAVAAGGFTAGIVTLLLVRALRALRRHGARRFLRRLLRRQPAALEVTGTRSFLVDIHLLKR